jgi:hypothetical protein
MRNKILIAMFGVALAGAASFGCGSSSTTNAGGTGGSAGVGGIGGSTGGAGGSTGGAGGSTGGAGGSTGGAGGSTGGAGGGGAGGMAMDCFQGVPMTHEDLINACTTAEKVDKTPKLPNNLKVGDMLPTLP